MPKLKTLLKNRQKEGIVKILQKGSNKPKDHHTHS